MGSWIGGDRDGNPFVTADVMRGTLRLQSSRILSFYLEELHVLGAELSLAAHLADISEELRALAERSPDPSPHRSGEPYRLAVSGIYARLTATAQKLEVEITRRPVGKAEPYASVNEFKADLDVLDRSLIANNSGRDRARALAACCGAPWIASASILPGSTSGKIPPCMNARSRSCSMPQFPACRYLALSEDARINLLLGELRSARPLSSAFVKYSEETLGELALFRAAAEAHATFGPDAIPPMHHLRCARECPTCSRSRCS